MTANRRIKFSGEMIRDLMLEAVEKRFAATSLRRFARFESAVERRVIRKGLVPEVVTEPVEVRLHRRQIRLWLVDHVSESLVNVALRY